MLTMPDNVGYASTPNYGGNGSGIYEYNDVGGKGRVFAGQTDDAFFLDLRVFDLLYGANCRRRASTASPASTSTASRFRCRRALSDRRARSSASGRPRAVPTTTTRQAGSETSTGAFVQVSRMGNPLFNEVIVPLGQKDRWSGANPANEAPFIPFVLSPEVPKLLELVYGIPAPATPRNDLVQVFLTGVPGLNQPAGVKMAEMIRLNTDILPTPNPQRMGVLAADIQGYPNGRRLSDDVTDITRAGRGRGPRWA